MIFIKVHRFGASMISANRMSVIRKVVGSIGWLALIKDLLLGIASL
jgi:hypothetical protein